MRETRHRGERVQRNGSGPEFRHEPGPVDDSLPRSVARSEPDERPPRTPLPDRAAGLPPLDPAFWSLVDDGLAHLRLELTDGARRAVDAHARLLLAWNRAVNLTAIREPAQVAVGHVLDSLSAVPIVRRLGPTSRVLDLGSGGGYPGLPVALALPAERCALVDSVAKKARFLAVAGRAAVDALTDPEAASEATAGSEAPSVDLSVEALPERAEDLADEPEHRGQWHVVLARAVGSMAEVAELGLPLLAVGGHLVAWKRDRGDGSLQAELAAARGLVHGAGGRAPRTVPVGAADRLGLPGHVLVVVRKERPTPDRFPRPPGERRRAAAG